MPNAVNSVARWLLDRIMEASINGMAQIGPLPISIVAYDYRPIAKRLFVLADKERRPSSIAAEITGRLSRGVPVEDIKAQVGGVVHILPTRVVFNQSDIGRMLRFARSCLPGN